VASPRDRHLLGHAVPLAIDLWHEPIAVVGDGDELVCGCDRCSALWYGNVAEDVVGSALFEDDCPNEEPPKLTALAMTQVPSSRWPSAGAAGE
jgi:hypothetical protein